MRHPPITLRLTARWLACAVALLPLAALAALAAPAGAATWRLEPIPDSTGVAELHELTFDARGHGLLSWNGAHRERTPPVFGGLAARDPTGGWQRPTDLRGIQPANMRIHLTASVSALLVAREARSATSRRRLIIAEGQSDGGFDAFGSLDDFAVDHWSAANDRGDAIVAWTAERSPFVRVAERVAGGRFGPLREMAVGKTAAVAINARGDSALVWRAGVRLAGRVRRAGGEWSRTVRFGPRRTIQGLRLSVLVARNGRVVATWGSPGRPCGVSVRDGGGAWRSHTLERRCGPTGVATRRAPVLPIADSRGATYVAWTGTARSGRRAVKLARVGAGGSDGVVASRRALVLSRERGAVLDDAAADANGALAITYSAPRPTAARPLLHATFAALRRRGRSGGAFGRPDRLTPGNVFAARGSRVAFQPLTGEPVVALPFLAARTVAVAAAVGPPASNPSNRSNRSDR
ncbi:MAG: hypothetical protein Q8K79_05210 [Solirubrobacteraceae bacterium]|nr:hypothetical protein [Solirubrobacteraceae bacterium]